MSVYSILYCIVIVCFFSKSYFDVTVSWGLSVMVMSGLEVAATSAHDKPMTLTPQLAVSIYIILGVCMCVQVCVCP